MYFSSRFVDRIRTLGDSFVKSTSFEIYETPIRVDRIAQATARITVAYAKLSLRLVAFLPIAIQEIHKLTIVLESSTNRIPMTPIVSVFSSLASLDSIHRFHDPNEPSRENSYVEFQLRGVIFGPSKTHVTGNPSNNDDTDVHGVRAQSANETFAYHRSNNRVTVTK